MKAGGVSRRTVLLALVSGVLSACDDQPIVARLAGRGRTAPLRVGINADYPPFESLDARGEPMGFDIALTRALAQEMGREVVFVNLPWRRLLQSLSQDRLDMVVSAVAVTPRRTRNFLFSKPYYSERQAVFWPSALSTLPIQQLTPIGVLEESSASEHLAFLGVDSAHIVELPDAATMAAAYRSGTVQVLFGDEHVLRGLDADLEGEISIDASFGLDHYAFVFAKGEDALQAQVDTALAALKADGRLAALVAQLEAPALHTRQ